MNFLVRNRLMSLPFSLVFFITRFNFLSVSTVLPSIVILWTFTFSFLSMFTSTYTCSLSLGASRSIMLISAFLNPFSSKYFLMMILARSTILGVICIPFTILPSLFCKSSRSPFLIPLKWMSAIRGRWVSSMRIQILFPSILSAEIRTSENNPWRQYRLTASVISSPGTVMVCPTASPEIPINT